VGSEEGAASKEGAQYWGAGAGAGGLAPRAKREVCKAIIIWLRRGKKEKIENRKKGE
jgi:hypothetical protein